MVTHVVQIYRKMSATGSQTETPRNPSLESAEATEKYLRNEPFGESQDRDTRERKRREEKVSHGHTNLQHRDY